MTWIAPDVERSEGYPARRTEPERDMLRDWLDWHRATLLRKCAGLDAAQLASRGVPPSRLTLLGLVRHMSDTERGWVRQAQDFELYRAECRQVDAALEGADLLREVIDGSAGL